MTNKLPVVGQRYINKPNPVQIIDVTIEMVVYVNEETGKEYSDFIEDFLAYHEEETSSHETAATKEESNFNEGQMQIKPETQNYDPESIKKDQMNKAMQSINDLRVYREGYNKGWNECLEEVKKQMPNHISELSPEVKEAMEELKKADNWFRNNASITLPEHCFKLSNTAFCLLNALDKQFSLNGYFEGLPPSREAIERSKAQPDENGSFKDIDGAEELSQELMKENIEPNKETLKSFSDYRKGVGLTKYDSVEELFDDLEGKNS